MGRGKRSREGDIKAALAKASAFLGREIELPAETREELLREVQSVINYFKVIGEGFRYRVCDTCGEKFAYDYHIDGIKYCGTECIKRALEKIGLVWHPLRPAGQRWGLYAPAVVPPEVLKLVARLVDTQVIQPQDTVSESQ